MTDRQIEQLEVRIAELCEMIDRLCDEIEGTHEHLENVLTGDNGGSDDPVDIVAQLRRQLPILARLDANVIKLARKMIERGNE